MLDLILTLALFSAAMALGWVTCARRFRSRWTLATVYDLKEMEKRMAIKVSEIKAAVLAIAKNNKEALGEIGNKIADLNKQIADLIAGVGDPSVTDEAFEADLKAAGADAQALADIVPGTTAAEPPATAPE